MSKFICNQHQEYQDRIMQTMTASSRLKFIAVTTIICNAKLSSCLPPTKPADHTIPCEATNDNWKMNGLASFFLLISIVLFLILLFVTNCAKTPQPRRRRRIPTPSTSSDHFFDDMREESHSEDANVRRPHYRSRSRSRSHSKKKRSGRKSRSRSRRRH